MDYELKTRQLCKLYNIQPARSKGQNFLINEEVYDKIINTADLKKNDIVLEVGPGLGFLTVKLAKIVKKVIACELDDKLAKALTKRLVLEKIKNVEVVNKDILKFKIYDLRFKISKIVASLPYNITSIFLRKFLSAPYNCHCEEPCTHGDVAISAEFKPDLMVLMLQKEVAERIVAKSPNMSLLAISVQFYSEPQIIDIVCSSNFWPEPKVDSAIIKLRIKNDELRINEKDFFKLVKTGFKAKRKMLKNNLVAGYNFSSEQAEEKIIKAGFNPKIRAQELSVEDWKKLLNVIE